MIFRIIRLNRILCPLAIDNEWRKSGPYRQSLYKEARVFGLLVYSGFIRD